MAKMPTPDELLAATPAFPARNWMDTKPDFRAGTFCYPAKPETMAGMGFANAHAWAPEEEDWHLPENWEQILYDGLKSRLEKHRSLKVFLDVCVRCGACADKCHFFLGTNDPKNMPVLRAELLRSVYRQDFTLAGKLLGKYAGARKLDKAVVKEWFSYFYQCSECRRCSLYCPYGIDTAELTVIVREMLLDLGLGTNWIMDPVSNCNRTGNHLGIQPHAMKEIVEFLCDDIETITGIRIDPPFNEKGHEILFVTPSGDYFAVSRKVQEALPRLQKNLPSDVKLGVIVDTSENILNTIDSLTETVMYALLFVVIVVFLFLGRWRATLIICITIPLSLIASFIYLAISGNTINIISLSSLSIAIGMVVDDAIVVLENVTTHIERGSDPKQAAVHGTNEVAISVVASTLTMIAVFFPLTMVTGMSGVLFKQLGWMMCAIMFVSFCQGHRQE